MHLHASLTGRWSCDGGIKLFGWGVLLAVSGPEILF
jgi:hypothetical protein